jgi:MFS transporter, NNP family, nitrate/nitrite transporter
MPQVNSSQRLTLFSFSGRSRMLHLSWLAYFVAFVVWFNHAPLMASIMDAFELSMLELKVLLIVNVALTIPAHILIGILVDIFGPRLVYSSLLFISSFICFFLALADSYSMLIISRFALGLVGAGFIVGIRMIGEWFPVKQVSVAEGIYSGLGNFGSAVAALSLPAIALMYGGENGWRYAITTTGSLALVYSAIYYKLARNTSEDTSRSRPRLTGAIEVTSKGDCFFYLLMNIPMYAALAILAWTLGPINLGIMDSYYTRIIYIALASLYVCHAYWILHANKYIFTKQVPDIHKYKFKQVAILNLAALITFGSELAVVSMLPLFFMDIFALSQVQAGLMASGYAFMNLLARPGGVLFSEHFGRRRTLTFCIGGLAIGYFVMNNITSDWPILLAVATTVACSFFVQAGESAVLTVVPLIKRRMTRQIAGMVSAYGSTGAVALLTVFAFLDASTLFLVITCTAIVTLIAVQFLDEPAS